MKKFHLITFIFASVLFFSSVSFSQTFNGEWRCAYATWDDDVNGTGYNTISVATISENKFVALVNRPSNNTYYLVGYIDADSGQGRVGTVLYGSGAAGTRTLWINGFDQVETWDANDIAAGPDGKIYVANNDPETNILVFELTPTGIETSTYRLPTSSPLSTNEYMWGIDVDDDGKVYITQNAKDVNQSSVLVYNNIGSENAWSDPTGTTPTILQEIILPDTGTARDVAVNGDGTMLFVSNFQTKKVYAYTGSSATRYTLNNDFNCTIADIYPAQVLGTDTLKPGPWGMKFMNSNNILFVASDVSFKTGSGYEYARVYAVNPYTGEILDTLDAAMWNYLASDSSYYRGNDGRTPGNASGYASLYYLDVDENRNLYTVSYYGWTVDKWYFDGTLPVLTSVERIDNPLPFDFTLNQNYPNPFNPSTTIEFSIPEPGAVTLSIYTVTGELVGNLIKSKDYSSGTYKVNVDFSNMASGNYIYTLTYGSKQISKKMMLIK